MSDIYCGYSKDNFFDHIKDMKEVKKDNNYSKGQSISGAEDASFIFIAHKVEKLSNALYVITKGFPDQDVIKWTMRERALRTMSFIAEIKDSSVFSREHVLGRLAVELAALLGLVTLSRNAGYISDMNAQILVGEYQRLLELAQSAESGWMAAAVGDNAQGFFPGGHTQLSGSVSGASVRKETTNSGRKTSNQGAVRPAAEGQVSGGRKDQIVKLMEQGKEYSIKDIFQQVPGVSEKTIQRELLAMVELGILAKKGERRWSTYSRI